MPDLPFILAGPILRRVTPRIISVWIALSKKTTVKLSVWDKEMSAGSGFEVFDEGGDPPLHSKTSDTLIVGVNLHIAVVTIDLTPDENNPSAPASLVPGTLYSYNLGFTAEGSSPSDLKSNKLLVEGRGNHFYDLLPDDQKAIYPDPPLRLALGYLEEFLPTFVLPPIGIDKINLVHGSCRSAIGYGKDCLAALDYTIGKAVNAHENEHRPHQLYLTGDQIYADIPPIIMLPYMTKLGNDLLGTKESIKVKKNNGEVNIEVNQLNFPVLRREKLIQKNANFTSKADHGFKINHLLSFGEFAATYIMYWNNAAWPVELYAPDSTLKQRKDQEAVWDLNPDTIDIIDTPESTDEKAKLKLKATEQYNDELSAFIEFRNRLPYITRVLANVPVFMIMDDHEVTDDWYMTKAWRNGVLSSPLGVNIIRNALLSYTLFQDWGNTPLAYLDENDPKFQLFIAIVNLFTTNPNNDGIYPNPEDANKVDKLFGFDLQDETPPPVKWHYNVPCGEITVYVLDTRTRRSFKSLNGSPALLSDSAMDDQIPLALQPDKVLVFVSPAPVLGLAVIEELIQPLIPAFKDPFYADPEQWGFDPPAFEKFLNRIQQFKKVILLSGDIHFGISTDLEYWKKGEEKSSKIIQLVSSALKNQVTKQEQFLVGGFIQNLLSSLLYPVERLGYNSGIGLTVTNPNGSVNPPKLRIRLRNEPVLLPSRGWPKGSTVNRGTNPGEAPDWSWRFKLLTDERPDDEVPGARPEPVRIKSVVPDLNPVNDNWDAAYSVAVQRHYEITKQSVARRVHFDCNIGLINFNLDDAGDISVTHSFLYWLPDDDPDKIPDVYTVYTSSLEPSGDPQPLISPINI